MSEDVIFEVAKVISQHKNGPISDFRGEPEGLSKAKTYLREVHNEAGNRQGLTPEDIQSVGVMDMVMNSHKRDINEARREDISDTDRERSWERAVAGANQIDIYREIAEGFKETTKIEPADFYVKKSLEIHRELTDAILERYEHNAFVKGNTAKLKERLEKHKDNNERSINIMRNFIHSTVFRGILGKRPMTYIDPYALIDPEELK